MATTDQADPGLERFRVMYAEPFGDEARPVGVVAIDADHRLHLAAVEPDCADRLELAVEMLNGSDRFMVHQDPLEPDSRRIRKRVIPRDAPDAREGLLTALREGYRLELVPIA